MLDTCLEALAAQDYPGNHDVTVVDDGSPTRPTTLPSPEVRVIWATNRGSYRARNLGAASTSGEILAFIDSDCIAESDWLRAGVEALGAGGAIVGGPVRMYHRRDPPSAAELLDERLAFPMRRYVAHDGFLGAGNMLLRRADFDSWGGFPDWMRSGGDTEFCHRALRCGARLRFDSGVVVRHHTRDRREQLAKARRFGLAMREREARGAAALGGRPPWRLLVPYPVAVQAALSIPGGMGAKLAALQLAWWSRAYQWWVYRRARGSP